MRNYFTIDKIYLIKYKYIKLFDYHNINYKKMNMLEVGYGHGAYTLLFKYMFKNIIAIGHNKKIFTLLQNNIEENNIKNIEIINT
tara:strand:- start:181 stop:435 length:255 start_codon:yes stop_codon:yes gene_type:complete